MKKPIMILVIILSAVLLVVASVMGTLAFLASSSAVSNTFTVGDVSILLYESKLDADGKDADGANRTSDGNSYLLIPNKSYVKDPAVIIQPNSVESYLFVKIHNGIEKIEKKNDTKTPTMKEQMIAKGWQLVKSNSDTQEELYLYVGFGTDGKTRAISTQVDGAFTFDIATVGGDNTQTTFEIFNTFSVDKDADVNKYGSATVTLTAYAIQADGFENAQDGLEGYQRAWNAIVAEFPAASGTQYVAQP